MPVPEKVLELVENFEAEEHNIRKYYTEEDIKVNFINKLFEALGWDVNNKCNKPPDQREVRFEDTLGEAGRPDYSFWLDRERKFFLDAKRPSVNIEGGINPAFQVKRYAWTKSLPLAIVTDFEEFAVYDCRTKPFKFDDPKKSRLLFVKYYEYEKRWDEIAALFSKEAVQKGSLGSIVLPPGIKVDDALLEDISGWRNALAVNIAKQNPNLNQKSLNYAVQMTIDRIFFLRICEDRFIEDDERLKELLDGVDTYRRLFELFEDADKKYNSGLFHFHPEEDRNNFDTITSVLRIEDEVLKNIIQALYYPDSPYVFAEIPADILGHVYEQFLGRVIQLDKNHKVTIEEKPEVRKAGGVYYTPTYIVDYIVENTVGKLMEGKSPKETADLHILDPACGSGSFLIAAYQYMLDWHLDWYKGNLVPLLDAEKKLTSKEVQGLLPSPIDKPGKNAKSKSKKIWERALVATLPIEKRAEEWHLRTAERKRILLNNIYGVDIDTQAVEVTKLSLLLKVLEGENKATITDLNKYSDERALPDLGNNIRCGNSLIGWDILKERPDITQEELERINPFTWEDEFKEFFAEGGFDAVIGNPPYIRIQGMKQWAPVEVEFYKERYKAAKKGNYDIYVVFVEKGLSLLNDRGLLGFILPHKFFNAQYGYPLRSLISEGKHLEKIVHFGDEQVFAGATTYTCLMFLKKSSNDRLQFVKVDDLTGWRITKKARVGEISCQHVTADEWIFSIGEQGKLFNKLRKMVHNLGDLVHIFVGLQTSSDKTYILEEVGPSRDGLIKVKDRNGVEWLLEVDVAKPFLKSETLSTFEKPLSHHRLIFPYKLTDKRATLINAEVMSSNYPKTWEYLQQNSNVLRKRESGKADNDQWYGYIYCKNLTLFEGEKLVVQVISRNGRYAYDNSNIYFTGGGNGPYYGLRWSDPSNPHSIHYLQGLLNSKLLDFYLHQISTTFRGGYWSYGKRFIEQIPIRIINFSDPNDVARHNQMVTFVETMLNLNKKLQEIQTPHEKTRIQNRIEYTDQQIDSLVYELYDLSEEEITIVEDSL